MNMPDYFARQFFIGVDPGTHKLGFAVIDGDDNFVQAGVLSPASNRAQIGMRLYSLREKLAGIFGTYSTIGGVGLEEPFLRGSVANSALAITGAYWMTVFLCKEYGIPVFTAKPSQLKALAGSGSYTKEDMIITARQRFALDDMTLAADAADACWAAVWARSQLQMGMYDSVQKKQPRIPKRRLKV